MLKPSNATHDKPCLCNTKIVITRTNQNIPLISKSEKYEEGYFQPRLHLLTVSTCELTQTPKWQQAGGPQHFQKKRSCPALPLHQVCCNRVWNNFISMAGMLRLVPGSGGDHAGSQLIPKEDWPQTGQKTTWSRNCGAQSSRAFSSFLQVRLKLGYRTTESQQQQNYFNFLFKLVHSLKTSLVG